MSKQTQNVRVTNNRLSSFDNFFWFFVIVCLMQLSGCDACKGTTSGIQCTGKLAKDVVDDFKVGYDLKDGKK